MSPSRRVRRARSVLITWSGETLVFLNYLTLSSASADPEAVRILHLLDEWTKPSDLFPLLPEFTPRSIRAGLRDLLENSLVVAEGSREAARDAELASVWADWLPYGSFHFATRDIEFLKPSESARLFEQYLAESRQPALVKKYRQAPRIQLPKKKAP